MSKTLENSRGFGHISLDYERRFKLDWVVNYRLPRLPRLPRLQLMIRAWPFSSSIRVLPRTRPPRRTARWPCYPPTSFVSTADSPTLVISPVPAEIDGT